MRNSTDKHFGHSRKILDYGRHVGVRWSPGSSAFYVNDYSESDTTNCLIVMLDSGEEFDLSILIQAQEGEMSDLWASHHKYVTCKSWEKGGAIVSFEGYGEAKPEGFERRYKFDIKYKNLRRLIKF